MAFIKSHSNYVLRKKHQTTSDGTIWERDITTIGGVNQFAPGQTPIYKSSNFIITVRNDGKISNQYNQSKWKENESGDTWTLETISGMTSEFEDQNDVKIVLKQDYYDFCDFVYYGSLSEMFRASISDILQRFPGELYGTSENAYYTSAITVDFEKIEERIPFGEPKYTEGCIPISVNEKKCNICKCVESSCTESEIVIDSSATYVDNPFSINFHSAKKPVDGKEIKYFANNGYKNYLVIEPNGVESGTPISSWATSNFIKVAKYEIILDSLYGRDAFYYDYLKPNILKDYFVNPNNEAWWIESNGNEVKEKSIYSGITYDGSSGYTLLEQSFDSGDIRKEYFNYQNKYWIEKSVVSSGDCLCTEYSVCVFGEKFFDTEEDAYEKVPPVSAWAENESYSVKKGGGCCSIGCYFTTPCKGYKVASTSANTNSVIIDTWIGDNNTLIYLSDSDNTALDKHIRPKEELIVKFYNECDNFEKLILDRKTTPKYKAVFSVIKENERGYYREMEEFKFPTSYGDYNIDASSFGFNEYTTRLAEIGAYYDEYFTDNLYRSMTHEAIKNFDWTYTREFTVDGEEEFVHGGEKVQKALRVFAREFDEILTYINNIKNIGRVTYDERSNTPDYFLIDELENKGWDVCLVYPYDLEEYIKNDDGTKTYLPSNNYEQQQQLDNKYGEKFFIRQFTQNAKKEVCPYSNKWVDEYPEGYFISCCGEESPCQYKGSVYKFVNASGMGSTYYDQCESGATKIKNRIKTYTDEKSYTYMDANNAFMRRMVINSPYIWRHKGTIEGIEMILGMFGFKSQRWVNRMTDNCVNSAITADYEITEYSSFTNRIEDKWDAVHQMYRIDWINSTKAIVYDYRSTSNYTKYGAQEQGYVSYQGLPVSYRYEYSSATKPYIEASPLAADDPQPSTSSVTKAFKMAETNEPVRRRYLYPNFNKYEQLDGNPYFQMNGGWLAKTVQNDGDTRYNFQFDVDDNIAYTCYVKSGETTESGDIIDNKPIYKETIRNIKRVDNIAELISTPMTLLKEGTIYYVSNIEKDVAVINNEVYPIRYEYNPSDKNAPSRYILLRKNNEYIKIGDDRFFTDKIFVYDKNGNKTPYDLSEKPNGYEVKAYILNKSADPQFICQADEDGIYTIDNFCVLDDMIPPSGRTNYFIIDDPYFSNRIAKIDGANGDNNGWRALKETDPEYIRINTITNYYEGNNPHNGNMDYDSGHEYLTYYKRLFKYAIDENMFDERCYENFFLDLDNEIYNYGFSGLVDSNEIIRQYMPFVYVDSKIHYFGTYYERDDSALVTSCRTVNYYGNKEDKEKIGELTEMYHFSDDKINVEQYDLYNREKMISGIPSYPKPSGYTDDVTNQILNNKRFTIKFYLRNMWNSNQGQCELKFLDDIVMNYLTQMIPSTSIVDIEYVYKNLS